MAPEEIVALRRLVNNPSPILFDIHPDSSGWASETVRFFPRRVAHTFENPPADGAWNLDAYCRDHGIGRVDWIRISRIESMDQTLRGARWMLHHNRVECVQFLVPSNAGNIAGILNYWLKELRRWRFVLLRASNAGLESIPADSPPREGWIIALHERITNSLMSKRGGLDIVRALRQYSIQPRGIILAGAHEAEELGEYEEIGFSQILMVEANSELYGRLRTRFAGRGNITVAQCAVNDSNGVVMLRVMSNTQSSSILPLGFHQKIYPDIREVRQERVAGRTLDHLLAELKLKLADFNFLHLDIQGAELRALRGADSLLHHIEAISVEVNYEQMYEGCPLVEELDDFLAERGFERVATLTSYSPHWGDALYIRKPVVSMARLGQNGRFANQVFQYAFLRLLADEHDLEAQTCPWIGQQLFGHSDPPIQRALPEYVEDAWKVQGSPLANSQRRVANLDICGFFQFHTSYYAARRDRFRSFFRPVPRLARLMESAMASLRQLGDTLVALHLRRGDYGYGPFFIPPNDWYLQWLETLWPKLSRPVLYIASDEPAKVVGDFARYSPVTAKDTKITLPGAEFYMDFFLLGQADAVGISNSSFSFAACMMNEKASVFMRPDLFAGSLIPFDPWNAEPLLHREIGRPHPDWIADAITRLRMNPGDRNTQELLRDFRRQVAQAWSSVQPQQLPVIFAKTDMWKCHELLMPTRSTMPHVDADLRIIAQLQAQIASASSAEQAAGPALGAVLYLHPSQAVGRWNFQAMNDGVLPAASKNVLQC